LTHPLWPLAAALIAVILTLPAIGAGLRFDDYHAKILFLHPDSPFRLMDSPLDLFRFCKGSGQMAQLKDMGAPWYTSDNLRAGFWRPLASATHWLDYLLWPNWPSLMHFHSILWYAAAAAVVACAYRRFMGQTVAAGLAALLYAVEDAHGMVVGFVANRNDLPAIVFGVLALLVHDRWRRERWRAGAVAAPMLLLASLLAKEAGIAACGYLAAYELFLRNDQWPRRLRALVPYVIVVLAWRIVWSAQGYGISGIVLYVDPVAEPGRFALEFILRAPLLLLAQWMAVPSEVTFALARGFPILYVPALAILAVIAVFLAARLHRDRTARFWMAGMILSVLPACTAFTMDRMLVWVGIGAFGLMAQFLTRFATAAGGQTGTPSARRTTRAFAGLLVTIHLILSPLVLPFRAMWSMGPSWALDQLRPSKPIDPSISGQDLIVVNPPEAFAMLESSLIWAGNGDPLPRRVRILLSSRLRPVEICRLDDRTLVVRPEAGFIHGWADPLLRSPGQPLSVGEKIEQSGMTVEITELRPDRRPAEAVFRFAVPLEDASLRWLQWHDGQYVPFIPPPTGQRVKLPGGRLTRRGFRSRCT